LNAMQFFRDGRPPQGNAMTAALLGKQTTPFPSDFFPQVPPLNNQGEIRNAMTERPYDRFARPIAETLSPTLGGYGLGALGAETAMRASEGDYAGAAANAPMLAMAVLPGAKKGALASFEGRLQALRSQIPSIKHGDDFIAQTPFEYVRADQLPEGSGFTIDQVRKMGGAARVGREEMVDLSTLKTGQNGVDGLTVKDIAERGPDPAINRGGNPDLGLPVVHRLPNGDLYILDGSHRLSAAALRGDQRARVLVTGTPK
jgi:hypothetical protein